MPPSHEDNDALPALLVILITILCPPIGVLMITGCSMDVFINICLTILGYVPGHIHAFYVEYVYFDRRAKVRDGLLAQQQGEAPGIYSGRVQDPSGGREGYGTV